MKPINFYRVNGPYGCFSNFSAHPPIIENQTWPSSEHYFQAQKFQHSAYQEKIRRAATPREAKKLGQSRSYPLRPDWEEVKESVMKEVLREKFRQHPDLRAILLSTGSRPLAEHTKNDHYWGDGGDGSGQNKLGLLLMEVRAEPQSEEKHST